MKIRIGKIHSTPIPQMERDSIIGLNPDSYMHNGRVYFSVNASQLGELLDCEYANPDLDCGFRTPTIGDFYNFLNKNPEAFVEGFARPYVEGDGFEDQIVIFALRYEGCITQSLMEDFNELLSKGPSLQEFHSAKNSLYAKWKQY